MNSDKEIRDLFAKYNVPLDRDDVWSVQSSRVVKHKALERLAAALNIDFDPPQILRHERDEAVLLVTGHLSVEIAGDGGKPYFQRRKSEWSIGEALVNANYRVSGKMAPYVYAMAEKRAKDRVIIKLAGLHGVYSEDEADEFKEQPASAPRQSAPAKEPTAPTAAETYVAQCKDIVRACANTQVLKDWWAKEADMRGHLFAGKDDPDFQELWKAFIARGDELAKQQKEAA